MARVFTISFTHQGEDRSAMIAVRPTHFYTEYRITLFDDDLAQELHSSTIISSGHNEYKYIDCLAETDLMRSIRAGVVAHLLQTSPVSSL